MYFSMPPKDDKKKDAGKSAKKDEEHDREVPNYKLMTPAVVTERLKIQGSLARAALQELLTQVIYTRNTKGGDAPAAGEDA
ncbi:unnamed protein product [Nyctereutes procyonoides]|uniref:40S ribosomal protein S25 n=1 Tax=Nyctereutes procyonoides TaxID=34880 RepID=A0A811Y9V9_NYCPR|nr:unnamed protein product [Nyctereutes procyonoides]